MAANPSSLKRKANDVPGSESERLKRARLGAEDAGPTHVEIIGQETQARDAGADSAEKPSAKPTPKPGFKRKKLAPPRPYPTVPASVSATGPRSTHHEKKNYIAITRKTKLAAYLRRCKDLVLKDGSVWHPYLSRRIV